MSEEDIAKGARSISTLGEELAGASIGIICLTPESQHAPWLNFEAGAISKQVERSKVCPVLLDMRNADLRGPLASFQTTEFERPDFLRLLKSINSVRGESRIDEEILEDSFARWWPDIRDRLGAIPAQSCPHAPERGDRDILEELLESVRVLVRDNGRLEGVLRTVSRAATTTDFLEDAGRSDGATTGRLTVRLLQDLRDQAARITQRLEEMREELSLSPDNLILQAKVTNLRRVLRELEDFSQALSTEAELIG